MTQSVNLRDGKHPGNTWRGVLAVLAICAVTISLATRYSGLGSQVSRVRTAGVVESQSQQFQRQRLLGNGLQWMVPAPSSTFFQRPRASVRAVSAEFTAIHLDSESWLYNRPPPSC